MNGDYSIIEQPPLRVLLIEDNPEDADLVRLGLEGESSAYSACQHIACPCYACPYYVREKLDGEKSLHFHVDWAATLDGRPRAACRGEDRPDLAGPVAARQPRHGYVPNHPQTGAPVAGRDPHRSRRSRARLPDHPRGGAGLPCQGSGHASAHGQNHSLRCGAQARPGRPAPLGRAVPTPLRDDPLPDLRFLQAHGSLSGRQPGSPRSLRVFQGGIPAERHPRPQHPRVRRSYLSLAGGE